MMLDNSAHQGWSIWFYSITACLQQSNNDFLIILEPLAEKIEFIICECSCFADTFHVLHAWKMGKKLRTKFSLKRLLWPFCEEPRVLSLAQGPLIRWQKEQMSFWHLLYVVCTRQTLPASLGQQLAVTLLCPLFRVYCQGLMGGKYIKPWAQDLDWEKMMGNINYCWEKLTLTWNIRRSVPGLIHE